MKKHLLKCILSIITVFSLSLTLTGQAPFSIQVNKSLDSVIEVGDSLTFTFTIRVENNGLNPLDSLRLNDNFPFPIGSAQISILSPPTMGMLIPNPGYNGDSDRRVITPMSGNNAVLASGDFFEVELIVKAHFDDYYNAPKPLVNIARAIHIDENGNVEDFDFLNLDFGLIKTIKSLTDVVTSEDSVMLNFNFKVINSGTVDLDALKLRDDIPFPFGSYNISVIQQPTSGMLIPNPNFDGDLDQQLLTFASGNASVLECRDTFEVELSLKAAINDINAAPKPILNTALGIGETPVDERTVGRSTIPLDIPIIQVSKTYNDYTILGDSIEFNFDILVENKGTTILDSLRLFDTSPVPVGSADITVVTQPTLGTLIANTGFNGDTDKRIFTNGSGNSSLLNPGDSYSVTLVIKSHFDDYYSAVKPLINRARAVSVNMDGNIFDVDTDTIEFPLIKVIKELTSFEAMGDSVSLNFNFKVINTGTEDLDSLRLRDELPFGFGSKMITIIKQPTSGTLVPNPNYNGVTNWNLTTVASGQESILSCRDTIEVELFIKVHLDSIKMAPKPILNRAITAGDNPLGEVVRDQDVLELYLPIVSVTKALSDVTLSGDSATFVFNYELINCGSDTLNRLRLNDKLPFVGGSNMITVVKQPSEGIMAGNSATPYSGNGDFPLSIENNLINTFSGGTGILYPGDTLEVELEVTTNICDYVLLPTPLLNSASGSGLGIQSGIPASDDSDDRSVNVADAGTFDDPTPLPLLPKVEMRKTLEDFIINGDSVKFTFNFVAKNIGNDTLNRIRIGDRLPFTGGTTMITILKQPSVGMFEPNAGFTGNGAFITSIENDLINTFSDISGRRLYPGDSIEVQLMVNASLCMYNSLILPQENPARATVDAVTTGIRVIDEDFALLPPLPGITINKSISTSPPPLVDESGVFSVTFILELKNSGNTELSSINLFENFEDQYGCAFVSTVGVPAVIADFVTGTSPTINMSYNGDNIEHNVFIGDGVLLPGDSMAISIEVAIDPQCDGVDSPLLNSAYIEALVTDGMGGLLNDEFGQPFGTMSDSSDDHTDFNMDMIPDNDSGEKNDTTKLYLPNLSITKAFISKEKQMDNDLLLSFEFEVRNTGNTIIDSLTLNDPIDFFPTALGVTPGIPIISFIDVDANMLPDANPGYDGWIDTQILDGISGILLPGESFLIILKIEIDPYAYTSIMPQPRTNQATISGLPKEVTGAPLINPATGVLYIDGDVSDLSDDGTELIDAGDPLSDNAGAEGNGLGSNPYDDPTPINICKTYCEVEAKKISHISLGESCMTEITASMVGIGIEPYCDYYFTVRLLDEDDNPLPSNKIDGSFLGRTLKVEIMEPECNNVSWGSLLVEDKWDPVIICADDTISCTSAMDERIPPQYNDNCGATIELRNEVFLAMDCDPEFTGRFVRTWVAVDNYGNESEPCVQTVFLERTDLSTLTFPTPRTELGMNALECGSGYATDTEGHPDPSVTGTPMLGMISLYPFEANEICNGYVEYEDKVSGDPFGCKVKIERTWIVGEWWCNESNEMKFVQVIEIIDTKAPVITSCPANITISTDSRTCEGSVTLGGVSFNDACGTDVHVHMQTPSGTLLNTNGATITLNAGLHTITYEVWDACHNMSTCSVDVMVVDEKGPVVICEKDLAISLNSNGSARILAKDLDLGSFDECTKVSYEARRMDDPCGISGIEWGDEVHFCCEDAGKEIMVALQVTDESGNTNVCMVAVEVQDKKDPVMACIDDVVITCSQTYAMNNLAAYFGMPTISDNCPSTNTVRELPAVEDINQCGIGSLHRVFELVDATGSVIQTCDQWITIEGEKNITKEEIIWPEDFEIDGMCEGSSGLHPDNLPDSLAYPQVPDGFCNLVAWKFADEVYDATTGSEACFKIIRTWKVIDWCNKETNPMTNEFPTWEWEQIIKVSNTTAPTITSDCNDRLIESASSDCGSVDVELKLTATDDCTPVEDLTIFWKIDLGDDGSTDDNGLGDDASGIFDLGIHRIYWEVLDRCGNVTRCDYTFEVRNVKAATPICLDNISVGLVAMDTDDDTVADTAMAIVRPYMIDGKSEHPCGYEVQLSFSQDVNDTLLILGCDDVGEVPISLWVTASNGVQSSCNTSITVTVSDDAIPFCDGNMNMLVDIEGQVRTTSAAFIEGVDVELMGSELAIARTSENGDYAFVDMPMGGNYEVIPGKDDDHLNGVSTLDIVMITRHVLGISEITSPYVMMAADINNSGSISATDIIELRKVILGHYDNFPNNTSWRFIDAHYNFTDPAHPWDEEAPETYPIVNLVQDMNIDFIGLKIGDISGDARPNATHRTLAGRSNETISLKVQDRYMKKGEKAEVDFTIERGSLQGYQLDLRSEGLTILSVKGNELDITDTHVFLDEKVMRMSINDLEGVEEDEVRFTMTVLAEEDGNLSEMLILSNSRFKSEAYVSTSMEVVDLNLEWIELEAGIPFAIEQNQPNPWTDYTSIGFYIPKDGEVTVMIRDMAGKLLKRNTAQYKAGENNIQIKNNEVLATGVLLYEVIYDGNKLHKRMIKVK